MTPAEYTYGDKHVFEFHSAHRPTQQAVIQDLIFAHIKSTLDWIPAWTTRAVEQPEMGIPYFGPCEIRQDGMSQLIKILELWKTIFEQGPEPLHFHSGHNVMLDRDHDEPEKSYWSGALPKVVRVSKKATLNNLSHVIDLALKSNKPEDYISYLGIQEGEPDIW